MSENTPLTDAAEFEMVRLFTPSLQVVDADFARGLELEIRELKDKLAFIKIDLEAIRG